MSYKSKYTRRMFVTLEGDEALLLDVLMDMMKLELKRLNQPLTQSEVMAAIVRCFCEEHRDDIAQDLIEEDLEAFIKALRSKRVVSRLQRAHRSGRGLPADLPEIPERPRAPQQSAASTGAAGRAA